MSQNSKKSANNRNSKANPNSSLKSDSKLPVPSGLTEARQKILHGIGPQTADVTVRCHGTADCHLTLGDFGQNLQQRCVVDQRRYTVEKTPSEGMSIKRHPGHSVVAVCLWAKHHSSSGPSANRNSHAVPSGQGAAMPRATPGNRTRMAESRCQELTPRPECSQYL